MTAVQGDSDGGFGSQERLGDAMSRVARQIQEEHGDVEATLQAIAASAIEIVPNAEECGITYVIGRAKVESRAWTSDLPKSVDALQQRLGQGPCLDAVWEQEIVRVDDVAGDERWPEFGHHASGLGIGSMSCFQLFVDGDRLGALNLYSRTPGAFDDDCQEIGLMFAAHAAIALAGAQHEEHLRTGMSNRDVIGQAKGILMERHRLTADQAFAVLTRVSQDLNRKLVDIARELANTGAVPGSERRRD
ncbi:GAF and ANTAR domain-containing protein [Blastococcus sp. BMG 814]|uniref:GAF and ANTAR domain-containing protein n=1 Tax=Blastococcus carthaginiensis TaxID=3050034 RepID=A0ABT9IDE5_9ACTN|nr:GAF and ANTAR domain-containing protein [Blastococcus carthaginiensis]MDP5183602.1 GAF and ANTAR domain-containing protein [Blastococcus carthaginiensis]